MVRRRPPRVLRILLGTVLVLVVVVVAAAGAATLLVDPGRFKPQIAAAVQQATGRELVLRGPVRIVFGLPPSFVAEDLALANVPGGSRPEMVTLGRVAAKIALLPLLRGAVEVVRLDLDRPDVLLETDAAGHGNWLLAAPPAAPRPDVAAPAGTGAGAGRPRLDIRSVHIRDGTLHWRDGASGHTATLVLKRLDADSAGPEAATTLTGDLVSAGRSLMLTGETGPLGRLFTPGATGPWPVEVVLHGEGTRLGLRGTLAEPPQGKGYALRVDLAATDLAPFAPLLPQPLPPLHDAALSVRIADTGPAAGQPAATAAPEVKDATLHLAGLELAPGLTIVRADLAAPAPGEKLHADVQAIYRGQDIHLAGSLGSLAALLPGVAPGPPLPLDLTAESAGAQATVRGTVAAPAHLSGLDLAVTARVPDLAAFSAPAGMKLPAWQGVAVAGTVSGDLHPGGTLVLHGLSVAMPSAQVVADLTVELKPKPALRGTLTAQRIDLDPLVAALGPRASPPAAGAPAAGAAPAAPAKPPRPARLIPDQPIDLAPLRAADADLRIAVAALVTDGVTYSEVAGHLVLQDGQLTLDPLTGETPGGRLEGRIGVDARPAAPPVSLVLRAPALSLAPLAAALGHAGELDGTVWVDADLHGQGATPHAIAASLAGRLGIAVTDADVESALLSSVLGEVMRAAKLPENALAGEGRQKLRCLALRLEAANGTATISTLVADAGRVLVQGGGTVELGAETLALRLRPLLRVGPGLVVPVRVGGTLREPKVAVDAAGAAKTGIAEALAGQLAGERKGADACAPALAAARGGPAPPGTAAAAPAAAPQGKLPKPADILRGLLKH